MLLFLNWVLVILILPPGGHQTHVYDIGRKPTGQVIPRTLNQTFIPEAVPTKLVSFSHSNLDFMANVRTLRLTPDGHQTHAQNDDIGWEPTSQSKLYSEAPQPKTFIPEAVHKQIMPLFIFMSLIQIWTSSVANARTLRLPTGEHRAHAHNYDTGQNPTSQSQLLFRGLSTKDFHSQSCSNKTQICLSFKFGLSGKRQDSEVDTRW